MAELFDMMTVAVVDSGAEGSEEVVKAFRQQMSKTGVEFMAKRHEPAMN
jgi:hypothetical protein